MSRIPIRGYATTDRVWYTVWITQAMQKHYLKNVSETMVQIRCNRLIIAYAIETTHDTDIGSDKLSVTNHTRV